MTHTRSTSIRMSLGAFIFVAFLSAGFAYAQSTGGTPVDPGLNGANNSVGGATQDGSLNGPGNSVGGAVQDNGLNGPNNGIGGPTQDGGLNGSNNTIGQTGNDVGSGQSSNDLGQTGNDVGANQGSNAIGQTGNDVGVNQGNNAIGQTGNDVGVNQGSNDLGQTGNDIGQTGNDFTQQGQMDPNLPLLPGVDQGLIGSSIDPSLPVPGSGNQSIWQDVFQWLGYQVGQTLSQLVGALFGTTTGSNNANPWGNAYGQNFGQDADIRYDSAGSTNLFGGQNPGPGEVDLYAKQNPGQGEVDLYGKQNPGPGEVDLYAKQNPGQGEINLFGKQNPAPGENDKNLTFTNLADKFFKFCWLVPGQQQCKQDSYFTDPKLTNNSVGDPLANELAQYVGTQDDSLIKDKNGNLLGKVDSGLQFGSSIDPSLKCSDLQLNSLRNIIAFILCIVQRALIPIVMIMALITFLWGIINYFIIDKGDENRQKGKKFILWAVIAFSIMIAYFGIIIAAQRLFGLPSPNKSFYPQFYYEPTQQQ